MSNQHQHASFWGLFAAGALWGCGAPPAAAPPASPDSPPPAPTPAAATPDTGPSAEPSPPSATAPPKPDLGPSPLHLVGEYDRPLHVFDLGDVGFVLAGDNLFEVRNDEVGYDRDPNRGLPTGEAYEAFEVAGEWPDTAFVLATRTDMNRRRTELFFWDGRRWKSKLQTRRSRLIRTLAPWNLRRVLALMQNVDGDDPSFRVVAGFPLDPVPHPSKSSREGCKAEVLHQVAAIARSGHVFAAGPRCGADPSEAAVEHWAPGQKKGEVVSLPGSRGVEVSGIVAKDESTAFVAGTRGENAYLASLQDGAWKQTEAPMRSGLAQLVAGPEATLWAVTRSGTLWKQAGQDAWSQVPMPAVRGRDDRMQAVSVWPRSKDDTWVVGRYEEAGSPRFVLLHSQPHEETTSFEVNP